MKLLFCLCWLFICQVYVLGQKKVLDSIAYRLWPRITEASISEGGGYITYSITEGRGYKKTFLQSVHRSWKREIANCEDIQVFESSETAVALAQDTLSIYNLETGKVRMISDVSSFKSAAGNGVASIACLLKGAEKKLILVNLLSMQTITFSNVIEYIFDENGESLVVASEIKGNYTVIWFSIRTSTTTVVYNGNAGPAKFAFNKGGDKLVFITKAGVPDSMKLVVFQLDKPEPILYNVNKHDGMECLQLAEAPVQFSNNGMRLFFKVKPRDEKKETANYITSKVSIWHYLDDYLEPQYNIDSRLANNRTFTCVLNLGNNSIFRLDREEDNSVTTLPTGGEYALITSKRNWLEESWKENGRGSLYLVSMEDGKRITVRESIYKNFYSFMAPGNNFVIYWDQLAGNYFAYDIKTGVSKKISQGIPVSLKGENLSSWNGPFGVAGWSKDSRFVYLYDQFDIWKVDCLAEIKPLNITSGFGRKHRIIFRFFEKDGEQKVVESDNFLYLLAFNLFTKENGFYKLDAVKVNKPVELTMGPFVFAYENVFQEPLNIPSNVLGTPIKAHNANGYLLQKMSTTQYPNLFWTNDFKNFKALTHLQPQQQFNWHTSELLSWNTLDGQEAQGILYKPQDFDSTKKYPVIFFFYEENSNALNFYHFPNWAAGNMDIATFVSNGYLVCVPDIKYQTGNPGKSVVNSVVPIANQLRTKRWVDGNKLGLQGHSFGGYEVNYLITQSNLFSAAVSAAGSADLISSFGTIKPEYGTSGQFLFDEGQFRFGYTLWERPENYLENSPVIYAHKVQTPLLLMHNKNDKVVNWEQAEEFFTALRRLKKRAWLLQYQEGSHQLTREKDKKDYSIRILQFFDHYLKHKKVPRWMVQTMSFKKSINSTGFEPDDTGNCGKECKVCTTHKRADDINQ